MIEAATRRARLTAPRPTTLIPLAGAVGAALTVLAGRAIRASGSRLGAFFPPFYAHWRPHVGALASASILVSAAAAALAPTLVRRLRQPRLFAASLFALALSLGVSINVARHGFHGLWTIFDTGPHGSPEAPHEYLPGLWALRNGIGHYLSHFPVLVPRLPTHVQGNPPGPLVALHLLGIDTPGALAALCIGLGALTAPLAYSLGRKLGGEERGRIAGTLTAFAPALLLIGVTSVDYIFATLGLAAATLLVDDRAPIRAAGAVVAAVGSLFSWLLLAIPAWAVLVVLKRHGIRRAVALTCLCAVALLALTAILALTLGYDPIATVRATGIVYRNGAARIRPYAYWLFGSPVAWGIALGVPIGWAALRAAAQSDAAALALAAIVIVSAVLGFTKAETERIWLPFVPLAAVAASAALPARRLPAAVWLLVAQALAVELLFDTIW